MPKKRSWTDEQLRAAVAASVTWREVLKKIGLSGRGNCHYDVRNRARVMEVGTGHFTSRGMRAGASMRTEWTDESIRAAVEASTSKVMVLEKLGLEVASGAYQKLQRRIHELGLDTKHFVRGRVRRSTWTDEQLRVAVASSRSYAQTLRQLGLVAAGGNYDLLQRRMKELAIDTAHFTGQGWNTGLKFVPRPALPLTEVLVADRWVSTHALKKRLFVAGLKTAACELCRWAKRAPDGRIPVELDHINGDKHDNRLENLRILCPNCHALQPTHRGLNQKRRKST